MTREVLFAAGATTSWWRQIREDLDAVEARQGRTHERKKADTFGTTRTPLRDGDQKLVESETASLRSALGSVMDVAPDRPEILYASKTVAAFLQSPAKTRWSEVPGCARRLGTGHARHWSWGDLRTSSARRCVGDAIADRAVQCGGTEFYTCNLHRGWTANVFLTEAGYEVISRVRQQCLPRNRPQVRHRQAEALGCAAHVGTRTAAE